jgi:hypothetical protein
MYCQKRPDLCGLPDGNKDRVRLREKLPRSLQGFSGGHLLDVGEILIIVIKARVIKTLPAGQTGGDSIYAVDLSLVFRYS